MTIATGSGCPKTLLFRAEGALSMRAPENIVENTSVRKKMSMDFIELVRMRGDFFGMSYCSEHLPQDQLTLFDGCYAREKSEHR